VKVSVLGFMLGLVSLAASTSCGSESSDLMGCGEGTVEVGSVCTLLGPSGSGDPDEPSDTGIATDPGEAAHVPNPVGSVTVSLSGVVVGYFDGAPLGLGTCLQVISRGSLYILGDVDIRAQTEVAEDGSWLIESVNLSQEHGPLLLVIDCEGSSPEVFPSGRFMDAAPLRRALSGEAIGDIELRVLRAVDVEAINRGLAGLSSPAFVSGLYGRVVDAAGEPLEGASVACVDGVCPTVYPVDDEHSDHVYRTATGAISEQTHGSGRYLVPEGTINTYVITHDDYQVETISTGAGRGMALFQDFQL